VVVALVLTVVIELGGTNKMLCLTDSEMDIVLAAARPLDVRVRDDFLREVVQCLAALPERGDGLVFRIVREIQRQHWDPPTHGYAATRRPRWRRSLRQGGGSDRTHVLSSLNYHFRPCGPGPIPQHRPQRSTTSQFLNELSYLLRHLRQRIILFFSPCTNWLEVIPCIFRQHVNLAQGNSARRKTLPVTCFD
jgi:hypothetical protein